MLEIVHNAYSVPLQLLKHFTTSFNATFCSFKVADFRATFSNYVWSYALRCDSTGDAYILGLSDSAFFTITIVAKAIFTIFDSITIVHFSLINETVIP